MENVTQQNLAEFSGRKKAILEFSAPWCGPCKTQKAILEKVASARLDVSIGNVDIDESFELANQFKVQSVPTIVVLEEGQETERFVGLQQEDKLAAVL